MARIHWKAVQKRSSLHRKSQWCVITHLEPNILECEVKWAFEASLQTKLVEVMKFQLSYFKSWKMMLWKCCTQYVSKFKKLSSGHRTGKGQFSFQSPKKGNFKEYSNNCTIALISHASKVMLKILQIRFNNMWKVNFQTFKLDLEKAEPEIKLPTSAGSSKKQEFQKNIYFCFIDYAKAFIVWITINCGKFWKRWEYQTTLPVSWEICKQVKKQQL